MKSILEIILPNKKSILMVHNNSPFDKDEDINQEKLYKSILYEWSVFQKKKKDKKSKYFNDPDDYFDEYIANESHLGLIPISYSDYFIHHSITIKDCKQVSIVTIMDKKNIYARHIKI